MKRLFVLLAILATAFTLGCDRIQNVVTPNIIEEVKGWDSETHSANYSAYSEEGTIYILSTTEERNAVIGIGNGPLFPQIKTRRTFSEGFDGYGLWKGQDKAHPTEGDGFGTTIAIHENKKDRFTSSSHLMSGGRALVAVGAPEHNEGGGALYVFRLGVDGYGDEGIWWEAKITPQNLMDSLHAGEGSRHLKYHPVLKGDFPHEGFGSRVDFIEVEEKTYLEIESEDGDKVWIPVWVFLSIG